MLKLISNITKSPIESKFRTIRATIPKIASTLFALPGGPADIVTSLGFLKLDEEHFVFVGDYFKVLRKGIAIIEKAIEPIKVKFMTPEEKATWDHNQKSIAIYIAEKKAHVEQQKKKKAYLEEMKRMQENDRKEKATEGPAQNSVANKLPFGANMVKF